MYSNSSPDKTALQIMQMELDLKRQDCELRKKEFELKKKHYEEQATFLKQISGHLDVIAKKNDSLFD